MLGDKDIIKKILSHLQALIIDTKVDISNYMSLKEIYDYELQLYSAISLSPEAYAQAFNAIGYKQEDLFLQVLNDVCQDEEQKEEFVNESKNLYYLNDDGLTNNPLYKAQVVKSENVILEFQKLIKVDLESKSHLLLFKEELDDKLALVKQLLDFASFFNQTGLEKPVEDINAFTNMLETLDLEEEEKTRILLLALKKNALEYKERLKDDKFRFKDNEEVKPELIEIPEQAEKEELMRMLDSVNSHDVEILEEENTRGGRVA